jgi:microcystin-dependent protein
MSEPFIGEVRLMSFGYPPKSWAVCNGQLLPINQNLALFSLLGTQYGGNGSTTFALPDLRGRQAVHSPGGGSVGQSGGEVSHTLTVSEIFPHSHAVTSSTATPPGTNIDPTNSVVATAPLNLYGPFTTANAVGMDPGMILPAGGSTGHENRQPYLVLNFCIALQGIFPSRN